MRSNEASDETCFFQLAQHHSRRRTIKTEQLGEGNLIDARPFLEHHQNPILGVGDAELTGFLQEQRDSNLLRPAKAERFLARAEVIKPGRTLTVVRADVFGISEGKERELVATMQGTMICSRQ